jgi:uncharacterized protein YkwD
LACGLSLWLACPLILAVTPAVTLAATQAFTLTATPAATPAAASAQATPGPMSSAELALLETINGYRSTQGRAAWQPEPGLAQLARSHSRRMAARGQLNHDGFQRRAAGTGSSLCVENLLQGKATPERAVQLWMQSRAHHDNLLEARAAFAGVGISGSFVTLLACASPLDLVPSAENAASGAGRR